MRSIFFPVLCCILPLFFFGCETKKATSDKVYRFDLQQISKAGALTYESVKSPEFGDRVLSIIAAEGKNELVLTPDSKGIDWGAAKYLVCEVWHNNPYSVLISMLWKRLR